MLTKLHDTCSFASAKVHAARIACLGTPAYPYLMPFDEAAYAKKIGLRLRHARKAAPERLTQGEAAARLVAAMGDGPDAAAPASRVSNYENGIRLPDLRTITLLCEIYQCSPASIMDDDAAAKNEQERRLLQMYRQTDERGRSQITRVAESQPEYKAVPPATRTG